MENTRTSYYVSDQEKPLDALARFMSLLEARGESEGVWDVLSLGQPQGELRERLLALSMDDFAGTVAILAIGVKTEEDALVFVHSAMRACAATDLDIVLVFPQPEPGTRVAPVALLAGFEDFSSGTVS